MKKAHHKVEVQTKPIPTEWAISLKQSTIEKHDSPRVTKACIPANSPQGTHEYRG